MQLQRKKITYQVVPYSRSMPNHSKAQSFYVFLRSNTTELPQLRALESSRPNKPQKEQLWGTQCSARKNDLMTCSNDPLFRPIGIGLYLDTLGSETIDTIGELQLSSENTAAHVKVRAFSHDVRWNESTER